MHSPSLFVQVPLQPPETPIAESSHPGPRAHGNAGGAAAKWWDSSEEGTFSGVCSFFVLLGRSVPPLLKHAVTG